MGGVFFDGLVSATLLSLGFASVWLVATTSAFSEVVAIGSVAATIGSTVGSTIRSGSEDSIVVAGVGIGSSEGMICWGIGNRLRAE